MNDIWVKNLRFAYKGYETDGNIKALNEISFCVNKGETVGIIGANGAGKTTLFRLMTGLLTDYEGELQICGLDVCRKNLSRIRECLGYVFQESDNQLFMTMVLENAAFGPRNYGKSREEAERMAEEALRAVGIEDLKNRPVSRISGGEKKMASIASVLAMEPEIVLMDEPSVSLDPKNRRRLIQVLNSIHKTKIIASHDLDLILETCKRTILISEGRVIRDGLSKEVLMDKELLEEHDMELPLCMQKPEIFDC